MTALVFQLFFIFSISEFDVKQNLKLNIALTISLS